MSSQDTRKGGSCREEKSTEQPGVERKHRKRRWGEALPTSTAAAEDIGGTKRKAVHEDELSVKRFREFRRGRSTSTCRFNEPEFETKHMDDWRCLVCYLWNDDDRGRCRRCGSKEGVDKIGDSMRARSDRHRPRSRETRHHSGHRDDHHYGNRKEAEQIIPLSKEVWPPVFDTHGSDYIFDDRSSMFYEAQSGFFYDPKSKLYYGNKQKAYFQYDSSKRPPFVQITETTSTTEATKTNLVNTQTTATIETKKPNQVSLSLDQDTSCRKTPKREITIKIRSTSRSRPRSTAQVRTEESKPVSHQKKEQLANIEKWSQKEEQGPLSLVSVLQGKLNETAEETDDQKKAVLDASLDAARSSAVSADQRLLQKHESTFTTPGGKPILLQKHESTFTTPGGKPILLQKHESTFTTPGGKPICKICMRKFPTLDKLRQHEQQSELHKVNLAKAEAAKVAKKKKADEEQAKVQENNLPVREPTIKYKDRASQRRMMYCDLPSGIPQRNKLTEQLSSQRYRQAPVNPDLVLGEHNIGNQLFQKLVSKANTRPVTARQVRPESSDSESSGNLANNLRKDWAVIESLSNRTAQQRSNSRVVPGMGLGSDTSSWDHTFDFSRHKG